MKFNTYLFTIVITSTILFSCKPKENSNAFNCTIESGKNWYDTDGKLIEGHAGGFLYINNTYYWYGEDHELGFGNKKGVCCYSSPDMCTWKNEGIVLPKEAMPELFRDEGVLERPKVIYNQDTKKYVMWMHLDAEGYTISAAGVAISDNPTGPFTFIKSMRPIKYDYQNFGEGERIEKIKEKELGNTFRDMNLFVDDNNEAYVIYSSENNVTTYISKLNNDFTDIVRPAIEGKTWCRAMADESREAPAPFKYKDKYYLITSGLTGWSPNPARYHMADNMLGPWKTMGDPCKGPKSNTTFDSQSTFVMQAPEKAENCFIFMADRWDGFDIRNSRFIWLPFIIQEDGSIEIEYIEKWNLSIFDNDTKFLKAPKIKLGVKDSNMIVHWPNVFKCDAYRVFKDNKQVGITCDTLFFTEKQLAGSSAEYTVQAMTVLGVNSKHSNRAKIIFRDSNNEKLTEFSPDSSSQGFTGSPKVNQSIQGGKLTIGQKVFETGFGTHAPSQIYYSPNGKYKRFTAWVGGDAYTIPQKANSIEFIVLGDGKELYKSKVLTADDPAEKIDVNIEGVKILELRVTDGGNGNHYDHANWCEPMLWVE